MAIFNQSEFAVRCEWGLHGIEQLTPISEVIVIVDVLSFSTCLDVAVSRGGEVYPFPFKDERLSEFAIEKGAIAASAKRSESELSLSPVSLQAIESGTRIVLPSPNGSQLTLAVKDVPVIAGCLRNAVAIADYVKAHFKSVAVVPAGERWRDGSLRPAVEDWIGAGAIISNLTSSCSPEALSAVAAFREADGSGLWRTLERCCSGKELIERGFGRDVEIASQLNVSRSIPILRDGAYQS